MVFEVLLTVMAGAVVAVLSLLTPIDDVFTLLGSIPDTGGFLLAYGTLNQALPLDALVGGMVATVAWHTTTIQWRFVLWLIDRLPFM